MSTKRQPSKQRRQTQNRAQREALEKRRQNVEAGKAPAGKVGGDAPATPAKTGMLSRLTGSGRTTTTGSSTKAAPKPGVKQLPTGYRAALTAVFLAFVGVVFAATLKAPVDHSGEVFRTRDDKTADWAWTALDSAIADPTAEPADLVKDINWQPGGSEAYLKAEFPLSLAIVLPLAAAGLAFWTVRRGSTSKLVNRCMYVSLFGALLTQQLAIMFLPAAIAIGVAGFQIKKEELANAPVPPEPGEDDVIDVDEVDDDLDDEVDEPIEVGETIEGIDVDEPIEAGEVIESASTVEADDDAYDEPDDVPAEPAPPRAKAGGGLQLTNRADDDD